MTIQVANYELLVAAACAGLNSILTLSAICLFYVYLRHRSDLISFLIVGLLIIPVAIFSNFIRVMVLVLITYYYGEAAAQGFLHDFAGLTLFLVALLTIIGIDSLFPASGPVGRQEHDLRTPIRSCAALVPSPGGRWPCNDGSCRHRIGSKA